MDSGVDSGVDSGRSDLGTRHEGGRNVGFEIGVLASGYLCRKG